MASMGAAMVLYEVLLTRVLALALFANVAFLAVAVALLGMGAGGWLASRHERRGSAVPPSNVQRALLIAAGAVLVAVFVTSMLQLVPDVLPFRGHTAISYGQRWRVVRHHYGFLNWPAIVTAIVLQTVPFFCGAYAQALIFARNPRGAGWIYAADLGGACAGAWSALLLLPVFGALNGVAVCTLLFLGAAFLLLGPVPRRVQIAAAVVGVAAVACLTGRPMRIHYTAGFNEARVVDVDWSALTRVSLYEAYALGSKERVTSAPSDLKDPWLMVDNTSRTQIAFLGDDEFDNNLDRIASSLRADGDVLIIGAGGGQEILDAHETAGPHGRRIDAVEVAAGIPRMMRKHFSHREGFTLDLPEVRYTIADGRSFVETAQRSWSVIQMKEVNFHSLAGQVSAAWSPSLLFTVEAFQAYLHRLTDDGLLSIVRFSGGSGASSLHLLTTLRAAADREGLELGPRLVIVDRSYAYGFRRVVLMGRRPFTPEELEWIQTHAEARGWGILRTPVSPAMDPLVEEVITGDPAAARAVAAHQKQMLLEPTTDDRPFGHQHVGYFTALWTHPAEVDPDVLIQSANFRVLSLIIALLLVASLVVVVLFVWSAPQPRTPHGVRLAVFGFLGMGFMLLEIVLIERASIWLGHPTVAFVTILTAMLLALGCGSLLSARFRPESMAFRTQVVLAIVPACAVLLLPQVLEWLAPHLAVTSRAGSVLAIGAWVWAGTIPLGWLLPTLMRVVGRGPALPVASGWALNGLTSVLGTVAAAQLVRTVGFDATGWLALVIYVLAVAGWLHAIRQPDPV